MGIISEFKAFALKGNMVDMAIGIIIGGAFGTIVSSLVKDVMMPAIGYFAGGLDFSKATLSLGKGLSGKEVVIHYGLFVNALISFLIVSFVLFMLVKAMNRAKETMMQEEEAKAKETPPARQEVLLEEIRDLLKNKGS